MYKNDEFRAQLLALLKGRNAHLDFKSIVSDIPEPYYNSKFSSIPYSAWELIEHMRIAQWDILEFIRNPAHLSPEWPQGYWPKPDFFADAKIWNDTVKQFSSDMDALESMVLNPATDFFKSLEHAPDYTILREILLVTDHNAYHLGQLVVIKRLLKLSK